MRSSIRADVVVGAIIAALREAAYADSTVGLFSRCLARLQQCCDAAGGLYTNQIGARFARDVISSRTGAPSRQRRQLRGRLVGLADSFLESGRVDLAVVRRPARQPESGESRRLLEDWEAWMRAAGWAEETVGEHLRYAGRYLIHLEEHDGCGIEQALGASVDGFLVALRATCSPSSMRTIKNLLARFARFAGRDDLAEGFDWVRVERKRAPLPVLTDLEATAVAQACQRAGSRDAAITILALTTGLRACDICALTLDDIDWRGGRISVVQQKTGNPVTLPLPPAAGNAISGYLLADRPVTTDRRVFIRSLAPFVGLSGHSSIRCVIKGVFDDAGVAPSQWGTRLTRHNLASKMLAARVGAPTISAVLGHADPASVDAYLETDLEQMRACVLAAPQAVRS